LSDPNTAINAKAAADRFQVCCMVFMLFPFVNASGAAQAMHKMAMAASISGPNILAAPQ